MTAAAKKNRIEDVTEILLSKYSGLERDWLPPERQLAQELQISRPLLREAIKQLKIQGYLEPVHGIGVKVIHHPNAPIKALLETQLPSAADRIRQFGDLRALVEPQIAAWAADKAQSNRKQTKALRDLHEKMEAAPTYEEKVELDIAFHRAIAELANNQVLALMLSAVADLEKENRTLTLAAVGVDKSLKQHAAILQAIESSDAAAAKRAMRAHIDAAQSQSAKA
ncbi:FCD domain-containing protein [Pelagicoccus enzymogenes]|uniref:FadR/GntR family transcriptional regulator n=1 Tax=Pelagicoccus enzymogenes TaxID=2773457 RepID=UPI00280E2AFF|nr:FCD domain-containing protein [Pelagicoccus enzymogenes]MDQ8200154.1 FCD domain-containing protein [Pelagicoccus enzymogenes]